jgi:nicotinamidase-related amidase
MLFLIKSNRIMKTIDKSNTALVITDPQNDFLHENGAAWKVVEESVKENNTIEHLEYLFKAAKKAGLKVFISPHYYYPTDHEWQTEGTLEKVMHSIKMFDRIDPFHLKEGSGADWLERYKPYINDGKTIICSPHKVYGPESNDLALQLRKHGINRVLLAGMSANLCVEAHMRELIENGFDVTVIKDATAGGKSEEWGDGYAAAMTNYKYIANEIATTDEVIQSLE